jgi:hypothetical protein
MKQQSREHLRPPEHARCVRDRPCSRRSSVAVCWCASRAVCGRNMSRVLCRPWAPIGAAILLSVGHARAVAAPEAPDYDRIDAFVDAERQAAGVPGAAIVLVEGERITHTRGFGEASPGRPVTADTPFFAGSLSDGPRGHAAGCGTANRPRRPRRPVPPLVSSRGRTSLDRHHGPPVAHPDEWTLDADRTPRERCVDDTNIVGRGSGPP